MILLHVESYDYEIVQSTRVASRSSQLLYHARSLKLCYQGEPRIVEIQTGYIST